MLYNSINVSRWPHHLHKWLELQSISSFFANSIQLARSSAPRCSSLAWRSTISRVLSRLQTPVLWNLIKEPSLSHYPLRSVTSFFHLSCQSSAHFIPNFLQLFLSSYVGPILSPWTDSLVWARNWGVISKISFNHSCSYHRVCARAVSTIRPVLIWQPRLSGKHVRLLCFHLFRP